MEVVCFVDGGFNNKTKSNGYGSFKVLSAEEEVIKRLDYVGLSSSNEAEYETLIRLLKYLIENYHEDVTVKIFADSKLMVMQVNRLWEVKAQNLKQFHSLVSGLFTEFNDISLSWIPRTIIVKQLGH